PGGAGGPGLLAAGGADDNSQHTDKHVQNAILEEFLRGSRPPEGGAVAVPQLAGAGMEQPASASPAELGWALSGDPDRQTDRSAAVAAAPSILKPVVFFDLWGVLLEKRGAGLVPGIEEELISLSENRLGVLCNAGAGRTRRDVLRALEHANIAWYFEQALIVCASDIPTSWSDRSTFAVAAALAKSPIEACVFVSRNADSRRAASAAGMQARPPINAAPTVDPVSGVRPGAR